MCICVALSKCWMALIFFYGILKIVVHILDTDFVEFFSRFQKNKPIVEFCNNKKKTNEECRADYGKAKEYK